MREVDPSGATYSEYPCQGKSKVHHHRKGVPARMYSRARVEPISWDNLTHKPGLWTREVRRLTCKVTFQEAITDVTSLSSARFSG